MSTILLIRHGQASFGEDDYDKLSALGIEQSRRLGLALRQRLAGRDALHVYAGAMRRHRETASACLEVMQQALQPRAIEGFNEFDHEDLIHRHAPHYVDRARLQRELREAADPARAFQQLFEGAMRRWVGGEFDADYTESWPMFQARCAQALERVVADTPRDGVALVFTSGGPISSTCLRLLGLSALDGLRINWSLANASVTKLIAGGSGLSLSTLNDHAHLEGEPDLLTYR